MAKRNYVSCIRINGVPILPPLLTPEKRLEVQEYREKAQSLEKIHDERKIRLLHEQIFKSSSVHVPYKEKIEADKVDDSKQCEDELSTCAVELDLDKTLISDNETDAQNNGVEEICERPKLVRSNSYTLENPSPILLEHLRRKNSSSSEQTTFYQIDSFKNESLHLSNESSIKPSISTETLKSISNEDISYPKIEVIRTDITVEQISITTKDEISEVKNDSANEVRINEENNAQNNSEINNNPENELESILQKIPEYSEQITKLVEKIKNKEHEKFENCDLLNNNIKLMVTGISPEKNRMYEEIFCIPKKQFEKTDKNIDQTCWNNQINRDKYFRIETEKQMEMEKKQKAAEIICAYTKGYLVRRLMKTTKVQNLIKTIHDALMCALDLQTSKVIDEADVELHRRLIQQVSAACYEFYHVFFALPTKDRMDVIAIDREQQRKKLLRSTKSVIDFSPKISSPLTRLIKSSTSI